MAILSRVLHHDKREKSPGTSAAVTTPQAGTSSSSFSPLTPYSSPSTHSLHTSKSSPNASSQSKVSLAIKLESPPIILYGPAQESTGSIVSGLLLLEVDPKQGSSTLSPSTSRTPPSGVSTPIPSHSSIGAVPDRPSTPTYEESTASSVSLDTVTLSLVQTVRYTRPFVVSSSSVASCKSCAVQNNVLARWDVVTHTTAIQPGSHAYPFSHLLPGSLPASSKLGSYHSTSYIKYELIAEANGNKQEVARVSLPLNIARSILRGPDRNSLRVFPPTEVTASAVLPNVVYPKSSFPIGLKLDNVVNERGDRRWRMRKLTWRIEESVKVRAAVCEKHESKLKAFEETQKRVNLHRELKTGGSGAAGSSGSGGSSGENKGSLHHSTIQTNTLFSISPSAQQALQQRQQDEAAEAAAAAIEARVRANVDIEPEREVENTNLEEAFLEDFGSALPSTNSTSTTTPSNNTGESRPPRETTSATPSPNIHSPGSVTSTGFVGSNSSTANPQQASPIDLTESIYLEEIRTVNHGEIKSGWKSDFSGKGRIELQAEISAINLSSGLLRHVTKKTSREPSNTSQKDHDREGLRNGATIACDIEDPNLGIYVNHTLVVEVVIAEELLQSAEKRAGTPNSLRPVTSVASQHSVDSPGLHPVSSTVSTNSLSASMASNTQPGVPSGAARVLRMQFKLPFTERSGLGIAWDDEVPPTYEDVRTLSPPTYTDSASNTPLGTPIIGDITPLSSAAFAAPRSTPGVIYGIGNTPVVGNFGISRGAHASIDSMVELDDRIQELTL
ncbi:protein Ldb19p [[Candida] anglica]